MPLNNQLFSINTKGGVVTVGNTIGLWGQALPTDGTTGNCSLDSSSNLLTMPYGSTILRAYLFYSGVYRTMDQDITGDRYAPVSLILPSGNIVLIDPENCYDNAEADNYWYHTSTDITASMELGGNYTVSSIPCVLGNNLDETLGNVRGGWTIVVIYQNIYSPARHITIWDEYYPIYNDYLDLLVSDFTTSPNGGLSGKIFASASNGNLFLSQINDDKRNLDIGTYLDPSQQSAVIRFDATGAGAANNQYFLELVALEIDLEYAAFTLTKSSTTKCETVGNVILYIISFTNDGNTNADNVVVSDNLDSAVSYLPDSIIANVPFIGDPSTQIILTSPVVPNETVTITFMVTINRVPNSNPMPNVAQVTYEYEASPGVILSDTVDSNVWCVCILDIIRGVPFL